MGVLFAHPVNVWVSLIFSVCRGKRRASDTLELEFQTVMSLQVDTGNPESFGRVASALNAEQSLQSRSSSTSLQVVSSNFMCSFFI